MCGFAVHLGTQLWTLLRFESGFRVGNVPATRLIVVSAFYGLWTWACLGWIVWVLYLVAL